MNRQAFYTYLRRRDSNVFGTSLSQGQVDGLELLLDEGIKRQTQPSHLAYILGTAYHETAHTMRPIREIGRGRGRKYGNPAGPYGHVYYGRGFVQLTWLENYRRASVELGIDFVKSPDRVMEPRLAATILFLGMEDGWFTGKKLSDYSNYTDMRRIVNGTDRASLIAGYARAFHSALREAEYGAAQKPVEPQEPPSSPSGAATAKPALPAQSGGWASALAAFFAKLFGKAGVK